MKKIILTLALVWCVITLGAAQGLPQLNIGFNFPNGGENIRKGNAYQLSWPSFGTDPRTDFDLHLVKSDGTEIYIGELLIGLGDLVAEGADFTYTWQVGQSIATGSDYKLRATAKNGGIGIWESDGYFSVCDNCSNPITLIRPNGGEAYLPGHLFGPQWQGTVEAPEFSFALRGLDDQEISLGSAFIGPAGIQENTFFQSEEVFYSYQIDIAHITPGFYKMVVRNNGREVESADFFTIGLQDGDYNTVESKTFTYDDGQQRLLSAGKAYFDRRGRALQNQTKNLTERQVLATQPVYDLYDRPSLETLPAPVGTPGFLYKGGLITNNGQEYASENFDGEVPDPVDKDTPYTVGWYYSGNNTEEPNTAISSYPFSRSEYFDDGTREMKRATGPGDIFHEDQDRKSYSKAFPVFNDLDGIYLEVREYLFGDHTVTLSNELVKTVSRDANGVEMVAYTDASDNVPASGYADLSSDQDAVAFPVTYSLDQASLSSLAFVDFHVPVSSAVTWYGTVRDLKTDQVYTNSQTLPKGFYRNEGSNELTYDFTYYNLSFNFYDNRERMILSVPPLGVKWLLENGASITQNRVQWDGLEGDEVIPYATYYQYDFEGRLMAMLEPDAGLTRYTYREDGSIRFSENALQRERGHFSYTNYDRLSRPVESGEYVGTTFTYGTAALNALLENVQPNGGIIFSESDRDDWVITQYDLPDADPTASENPIGVQTEITLTQYDPANTNVIATERILLKSGFHSNGGTFYATVDPSAGGETTDFTIPMQYYVDGAVSYSENEHTKTWYSYDELGRVTWMATWQKEVFDAPKIVYYTYDFTGNVVTVMYQPGEDDQFFHHYKYDADNRLSKVYAAAQPINEESPDVAQLQATYEYYLHGPMKRMTLGNDVQETEYLYTIQGWLKSLNDPNNLGNNAFAQTFHYFSGDYNSRNYVQGFSENSGTTRVNQYTGNIAGLSAVLRNTSGTLNPLSTFNYAYDDQYQLKSAVDNTGSNIFRVDNLRYDANGNILSLNRRDGNGNFRHQLNYVYGNAGTNQLTSIPGNNLVSPAIPGYATSYDYDAIGQLKRQELIDGSVMRPDYDVSGKVERIFDDNNVLQLVYDYDDRGFRVRKKDVFSGKETIYVRDASGQLLSTYIREVGAVGADESVYRQEETPVYGSAKLGFWQHASGLTEFELKDHLGNVRAKLDGSNGSVSYFADYYPFGSVMREGGVKGKYGYQGDFAEKDEETGWNHFEAREYDPVVGRWLSIDPARQFYSPYVNVGNNPIVGYDPDGRFCPKCGNSSDYAIGEEIIFDTDGESAGARYLNTTDGWVRLDGDIYNPSFDDVVITGNKPSASLIHQAPYVAAEIIPANSIARLVLNTDANNNVPTVGDKIWSGVDFLPGGRVLRGLNLGIDGFKFVKPVFKTIVESQQTTQTLLKLKPSVRANVEKAIDLVHQGLAGGNQHKLTGDLKGFSAIDVKGSGKGRGKLRVVFQETDNEIFIHSIQDYH